MLTFFSLAIAISALFLFGGFAADLAGIGNGINAANGRAIRLALIAAGVWSAHAALFAAWLWGWAVALAGLAISGLLHWTIHKLPTALLQSLIDRKNATERSLP